MTENEVLGFNPQDLFNNQSGDNAQQSPTNSLIYKTKPSESVSEDGHYRAKIKIIYNPENPKASWLEQQSYGLQDKDGFFNVISSLTVDDKSCPVFTSWKKCHFAEKGTTLYNQALPKDQGGKGLYDKRFARYVIVQILKDKNQPDLVGSFKLWKLPTSIYTLLQNTMNPSKESGKMPIPVLDYLFGRAITIDVAPGPDDKANPLRKTREITYTGDISKNAVSCINPDGSPLLNDEEQEILDAYIAKISKAWDMECEDEDDIEERNKLVAEVNSSDEYKALLPIYSKVFAQIKEWAPKLDTLSYKEWPDSVKTRVANWIKVVESGNDPAQVSVDDLKEFQGASDDKKEEKKNDEQPAPSTAAPKEEDTSDDLPF
jgi:hypothetical protein